MHPAIDSARKPWYDVWKFDAVDGVLCGVKISTGRNLPKLQRSSPPPQPPPPS